MMLRTALVSLFFLGLTSADDVVSIFVPGGANNLPLAATVAGSSGSVTTYVVNCPATVNPTDCPMSPLTIGVGPSTERFSMVEAGQTVVAGCSLGGPGKGAICSMTQGGQASARPYAPVPSAPGPNGPEPNGPEPDGPGPEVDSSFVTTLQPSEVNYFPITVVSGSEASTAFSATPAATTGSGPSSTSLSTTSSSAPSSTSGASSFDTSTTSGTTSSATAETASTSSSTAGVPHITGNAQLVLGGLAVAVAVAGL